MSGLSDYDRIPFPELPSEYDDAMRQLKDNFRQLLRHETTFGYDLALRDHAHHMSVRARKATDSLAYPSRDPPDDYPTRINAYHAKQAAFREDRACFDSWAQTAARDAVFSVYHFRMITHAINEGINKIPALNALVKKELRKEANRLFESRFPDINGVRNSTAHSAERGQANRIEQHSIKGGYQSGSINATNVGSITLIGVTQEDQFTVSHEGKALACEISPRALDWLREIRSLYFTFFGPLKRKWWEASVQSTAVPKASTPAQD